MTVDPFLFTLLIELLVVTSAVAIAMFMLTMVRKKRDRKAVQVLVAKINEGQEKRLGESREILTSRFGIDGEQAAKLATEIDSAERGFYQAMIAAYLRRDHESLKDIDADFIGAVETYRTLTPSGEGGGDQSEEIARLRKEKERLSAELKSAMEAMGGVLNDYSSILADDGEIDDKEQVEQVEAKQVEQGTSSDDGIVVEEIAGGATEQPAEEAAKDSVEPTAESAAAEEAAEDIDIPDYSGLEEPKID
jgi:hypothetical protein